MRKFCYCAGFCCLWMLIRCIHTYSIRRVLKQANPSDHRWYCGICCTSTYICYIPSMLLFTNELLWKAIDPVWKDGVLHWRAHVRRWRLVRLYQAMVLIKKSPLMYAAFWFPFADITHALNIVNTRTVINDSSSRTVSLTYLGLVANRLCAGQNTLVRLFTSLRHSTNKCSSCLITAHSRRVR